MNCEVPNSKASIVIDGKFNLKIYKNQNNGVYIFEGMEQNHSPIPNLGNTNFLQAITQQITGVLEHTNSSKLGRAGRK